MYGGGERSRTAVRRHHPTRHSERSRCTMSYLLDCPTTGDPIDQSLRFASLTVTYQVASLLKFETQQLHIGDGEVDPSYTIRQLEQDFHFCQLLLASAYFARYAAPRLAPRGTIIPVESQKRPHIRKSHH